MFRFLVIIIGILASLPSFAEVGQVTGLQEAAEACCPDPNSATGVSKATCTPEMQALMIKELNINPTKPPEQKGVVDTTKPAP